MSTVLDRAIIKAAELRKQLAELERFIELHRILSDDAGIGPVDVKGDRELDQGIKIKGNMPVDNFVGEKASRGRDTSRKGPAPPQIVEMVERMIREIGRPMTRGEIVEKLVDRDVELPPADPQRYVGTIMWRNKGTFINIEGRGYWLRR